MEFVELYETGLVLWGFSISKSMSSEMYLALNWKMLLIIVGIAAAIMIGLFVLQGIGIYTIAKNSGVEKAYLAFVPFVNLHYLGKMLGGCNFFGQRFKNVGTFAMIAQIFTTVLGGIYIGCEIWLYYTQGAPMLVENYIVWTNVPTIYNVASMGYSFARMITEVLVFLLFFELLRSCQLTRSLLLSIVILFVPISRFVIAFAIRKSKRLTYEEMMQKQAEEMRRRFQMYSYPTEYPGYTPPAEGEKKEEDGEPSKPDSSPFEEFDEDPFKDI